MRAYVPVSTGPAIRLDANESPHALPPEARALLADALGSVAMHRYPDVRATRLRELIAERAGAHPDEVVIGCGSDEAIALLLLTLAVPRAGRERAAVLFPEPTFVMFRVNAVAQGLDPVGVPLDDAWDLDVPAMRAALAVSRPNVVFLPSPNNPTGNLFARDRVEAVVDAAPDALVVLDEAYGPFTATNYRDLRLARPNVAQLQTLSKLGLAAARVGWGILPRGLAAEVDKVRQPYNLNALSQRAAELPRRARAALRPRRGRHRARAYAAHGGPRAHRRSRGVAVAVELRVGGGARRRGAGARGAPRATLWRGRFTPRAVASRGACASPWARATRTTRCSRRCPRAYDALRPRESVAPRSAQEISAGTIVRAMRAAMATLHRTRRASRDFPRHFRVFARCCASRQTRRRVRLGAPRNGLDDDGLGRLQCRP